MNSAKKYCLACFSHLMLIDSHLYSNMKNKHVFKHSWKETTLNLKDYNWNEHISILFFQIYLGLFSTDGEKRAKQQWPWQTLSGAENSIGSCLKIFWPTCWCWKQQILESFERFGGELWRSTIAVASSRGEWSADFGELSKICAERALKKTASPFQSERRRRGRERNWCFFFGNPCKSHHQK